MRLKKYSIGDIKLIDSLFVPKRPIMDLRPNCKVAIIDDDIDGDVQELCKKLTLNRFNVHYFPDIDDIDLLSTFHIIVFDIEGVGLKLGGNNGSHLIKEVHNKFPEKYLIVSSAQRFNPSFNKIIKLCNQSVDKNNDLENYLKMLDEGISELFDPVKQWKKIHKQLIDKSVPTKLILKIEDQYVRAIKKNKSTNLESILKKIDDNELILNYSLNVVKMLVSIISPAPLPPV